MRELFRLSFHECTARVLNALFDTRLTGADIELCVGKRPVRLRDLGQRMVILECWHTPAREESGLSGVLARLIRGGGPENAPGTGLLWQFARHCCLPAWGNSTVLECSIWDRVWILPLWPEI